MDFLTAFLSFTKLEENFKSAIGNEKSNIIGRLVDEMKTVFCHLLTKQRGTKHV